MEFTIKRSEWLRGEGGSKLLRARDGKKCCLGFFSLACGLTAKEIEERNTVWEVGAKTKDMEFLINPVASRQRSSNAAFELMRTNDHPELSDAFREQSIAAKFHAAGHVVHFVD